MKKFLTYFLLAVYVFSFTEARQALKLPNLVEHYISYTLKYKDASFFSFFKTHYWDAQTKDSDYDQDMKLPFKICDFSGINVDFSVLPKIFEFSVEHKEFFKETKQNFGYSEPFTTYNIASVFRPPILS
jgi:hypothetical protein